MDINFIMSSEHNSPGKSSRLNPEFIGIAKKLNSQKQRRLSLKEQRDENLRTLKYKISVDTSLGKGLIEQSNRLSEVKSVHHRRINDQQFKRQQYQLKKMQLRSLSTSVKERREDLRSNIKQAKLLTFNRNRKSQMEQKYLHNVIENRIKRNIELNDLKNKKRFINIKNGEKHSQNMVDKFYKTLNKQSLDNYQQLISQQNEVAQQYEQEIKTVESAIEKYDKSIEKKRDKMMDIFCQIQAYTDEPPTSQSKCLPLYLRPQHNMTSSSSRPRDILLGGTSVFIQDKNTPDSTS